MGPGNPFPDDVNEQDLEKAVLLDHFRPERRDALQKAGLETWSCTWSPDASYIAWSCGNRIVKLIPWNRYKHTAVAHDSEDFDGNQLSHEIITIDAGELVWAVAFGSRTADTKPYSTNLNWYRYHIATDLLLATGLSSGRIRVYQVKTGSLMLELLDHKDVIRDLKFAPDESIRLLSASRDGTLKLWQLEDDGNMSKTLKGNCGWVYSCTWSPDAKIVCSTGDRKSVYLWDMTTYKQLYKLEGHNHNVCCCDFSPDGALLVTASYDTEAIIWDPYTGEKLKILGHMYPTPSAIFAGGANGSYVRGISFSHDGRHIATVCDDSYLRFWDMFNSEVPEQVAMVTNALCASYSPDGAVLAVGTRSGSLHLWMSPMQVSSLQHLCRTAIRRLLPSSPKLKSLVLPTRMRDFLMYRDPQSLNFGC